MATTTYKIKEQAAYFGVPGLHAQLDEPARSARLPDCPYCELLLQTVQQFGQLYTWL